MDVYADLDPQGYHNFGVVEEALVILPDPLDNQAPTMEPTERVLVEEDLYLPLYRLITGSLHAVTGLELRRRGKRCIGLRILHSNGLDDYLGSWNPLHASSISTLYDLFEGPQTTLQFHLTDGEYERAVRERYHHHHRNSKQAQVCLGPRRERRPSANISTSPSN